MTEETPEPAQVYLQLRQRVFSLTPEEVNIPPTHDPRQVWAVVMETGFEVGSATLVCLADGTTSLYYSTGGGMLGSSDYAPIAEAARLLVARAQELLTHMDPTTGQPLPQVGQVSFHLLTFEGIFSASARRDELLAGGHALSPLFDRAQDSLTQLRDLAEKKHR